MPSAGASAYPSSFSQELPDSPSASSPSSITGGHLPQQTFLERLTGLPLVRAGVARVQDAYRATKERHDLLKSALEAGESTVTSSLTRAAGLLQKTGLSERLQKPRKSCVITALPLRLTSPV